MTAPKPTDGAVQSRVEPEPVQVPAAPELEDDEVEVDAVSAAAEVVATAAAEVACHMLGKFLCVFVANLQHG